MAARQRKSTRPREHWGILFALVVVLSLWFATYLGREPGSRLSVEAENGTTRGIPPEATEPNDTALAPPDHSHVAFAERVEERREMVARQIHARQIKDPNVLKAMRTVPRHAFMPTAQQPSAYADSPLPIGEGQTISQPYIVAFMTEALALDPNSRVLEIGTGSGYQAAVCAEIARAVYTIEIIPSLAQTAAVTLKELGYRNVFVKTGDGYFGWPEKGPFDAIIGTAVADRIPPPLVEQLGPGGRMILPHRDDSGYQYLVLITKDEAGRLEREKVLPVVFVPMTGQVQKPADD
ncbi:MAG: protein-L-isoaspartate(D-aspartate) O-methyltransferase [Sedimentisphaerales bacterium]|nr:protein-L-isoaspartate(D-aspartate) O-methyltransferase [Sedimentisphaerales bacterium]